MPKRKQEGSDAVDDDADSTSDVVSFIILDLAF